MLKVSVSAKRAGESARAREIEMKADGKNAAQLGEPGVKGANESREREGTWKELRVNSAFREAYRLFTERENSSLRRITSSPGLGSNELLVTELQL